MTSTEALVLVVGLDPARRDAVREALEAEGCTCAFLGSASEAQQGLEAIRPDAVVVDLPAGDRDVVEWVSSLASRDPALGRRTVVLLATGSGEDDAPPGATRVTRPFEPDELARSVVSLLGFE